MCQFLRYICSVLCVSGMHIVFYVSVVCIWYFMCQCMGYIYSVLCVSGMYTASCVAKVYSVLCVSG
jgi:hypothetical protein